MTIKAKMKATALGALFRDFFLIFLASNRDFGRDYHLRKFHWLLRPIRAQKGWCVVCWQNGDPIFPAFFNFSASISYNAWPKFWHFLFDLGCYSIFLQLKVIIYNNLLWNFVAILKRLKFSSVVCWQTAVIRRVQIINLGMRLFLR